MIGKKIRSGGKLSVQEGLLTEMLLMGVIYWVLMFTSSFGEMRQMILLVLKATNKH